MPAISWLYRRLTDALHDLACQPAADQQRDYCAVFGPHPTPTLRLRDPKVGCGA
jgi:hypothetical protein